MNDVQTAFATLEDDASSHAQIGRFCEVASSAEQAGIGMLSG
jgi:hypothetical protein